jgi:hypothetical protein
MPQPGRDRVVPYVFPTAGPAVLIQEGGYNLASLGGFAVAALTGVAAWLT